MLPDLLLLRHARAGSGSPDSARRLTTHGEEQVARLAVLLSTTYSAGLPLLLEPSRTASTFIILIVTAAVGSLIPLRRLARIDPAAAIS